MKQAEFAKIIAKEIDRNIKGTNVIVSKIFEEIAKQISKGETVSFIGFGKFDSKRIKSRNGVNPNTLEKIIIPELNRAKFTPSTSLKSKLNK